jgi:hypothetical protein
VNALEHAHQLHPAGLGGQRTGFRADDGAGLFLDPYTIMVGGFFGGIAAAMRRK